MSGDYTRYFSSFEKKVFNSMMEAYDASEYKKSLTLADKVLVNHPDHAECNAFKALVLNASRHKEEAIKLISDTLMKNMKNFTCWHVQGMIQKQNKEYKKAIQSIKVAIKIDVKNSNALRDLGLA